MIRRLSSDGRYDRIISSALKFCIRITLSFKTNKKNSNKFHALLYTELTTSFLIGRKRTKNFRNERL